MQLDLAEAAQNSVSTNFAVAVEEPFVNFVVIMFSAGRILNSVVTNSAAERNRNSDAIDFPATG